MARSSAIASMQRNLNVRCSNLRFLRFDYFFGARLCVQSQEIWIFFANYGRRSCVGRGSVGNFVPTCMQFITIGFMHTQPS